MKIDCDTCAARPIACGGCIMSVLMPTVKSVSSGDAGFDAPSAVSEDDIALAEAVSVFGAVGLVTQAESTVLDIAESAGYGRGQARLSVVRRAG